MLGFGVTRDLSLQLMGGLTSCGAWALELVDSVAVAGELGCPVACGILVPGPGVKPDSCVAGRILNHWTAREVPGGGLFDGAN